MSSRQQRGELDSSHTRELFDKGRNTVINVVYSSLINLNVEWKKPFEVWTALCL